MIKRIIGFSLLLTISGYVIFALSQEDRDRIISPIGNRNSERSGMPLNSYSFKSLREKRFSGDKIVIGETLKADPDFASHVFYFHTQGKKVSGLINLPTEEGTYPIIILFRGFIEPETYTTGSGTRRVGEELARSGFITLAPDFLGYGESDDTSDSTIEARFQTYTTALDLLASVGRLNTSLKALENEGIHANADHVGIWGHSNGGQIALSVLEIGGFNYPTVLWAPVSKPFPYSILYYTDEFDDRGKALRRVLAEFEKTHDVEHYSTPNFLDWIRAPLQIHQGEADEQVPESWSGKLVEALENLDKDVSYFTYQGEDHNFTGGSWNRVLSRSVSFYRERL